ncbi:hypothetical protein BUALT_Bualt12G0102200 [Buddleja alternifolia]|uniref:Uncharacterized protein n=1 Tax=Buddleja alternifolia TaxID=168488 RepID=A0AAV6WQM9_9LAMI|nr:hypothetical protein BUALT_Bualt12G0102200 [Buddleja alternifolia]
MADHARDHKKKESTAESLIEKITEKFHRGDSSSSNSDYEKDIKSATEAVKELVMLTVKCVNISIVCPPKIPEVIIPEDIVLGVASALRIEFNRALPILRDIASGRDLKKFLAEDQVHAFAEKAEAELKKQYVVFNVKDIAIAELA